MLSVQQFVGGPSLGDEVLFLPTCREKQGYNGVGGSMAALELPANQGVNNK
jgi:hypothetical protein